MKYISTSALAREMNVDPKELFAKLKDNGWIYKKDDQWQLTKNGRIAGGDMEYNPKFGEYVVWPINLNVDQLVNDDNLIRVTDIGEKMGISSKKVNLYLNDLGWIQKERGGWVLTLYGHQNGGFQMEFQDGKPYSMWDKSILQNYHFQRVVRIGEGQFDATINIAHESEEYDNFRSKYPATLRTSDGHMVRSRAELLIDNFFYHHRIAHAYEKKVNIDEPMYSDFYLPAEKIFVEFWGMEEDTTYAKRKLLKQSLYAKYQLKLIELKDSDIENLDEVLEAKLRRFNIVV